MIITVKTELHYAGAPKRLLNFKNKDLSLSANSGRTLKTE